MSSCTLWCATGTAYGRATLFTDLLNCTGTSKMMSLSKQGCACRHSFGTYTRACNFVRDDHAGLQGRVTTCCSASCSTQARAAGKGASMGSRVLVSPAHLCTRSSSYTACTHTGSCSNESASAQQCMRNAMQYSFNRSLDERDVTSFLAICAHHR